MIGGSHDTLPSGRRPLRQDKTEDFSHMKYLDITRLIQLLH